MILNETIIAPATNCGTISALAVVRLSGPLAERILQTLIKRETARLEARKCYHLKLYHDKRSGVLIDDAVIVLYRAPHSFCGEDTVEFFLHGSPLIVQELIEKCLSGGARLADRGEFSLKAVLNGKISLPQAEQTNALIHAPTARAKSKALSALAACHLPALSALSSKIEYLLAYFLQILDYPEEYEDQEEQVALRLDEIGRDIEALIAATQTNMYLFTGVKVVIIGEPNAGKSTLLNALLGEEKAIVTPLEGTTRDIVEGQKEFGGLLFHFFDTAGLRETEEPIEKIGVERSYRAIEEADLVLELSANGSFKSVGDLALQKALDGRKTLRIATKKDLGAPLDPSRVDLYISALDGDGVRDLWPLMIERLKAEDLDLDGLVSAADLAKLKMMAAQLKKSKTDFLREGSYDLLCLGFGELFRLAKELQGLDYDPDQIYDTVFKNFCVGK